MYYAFATEELSFPVADPGLEICGSLLKSYCWSTVWVWLFQPQCLITLPDYKLHQVCGENHEVHIMG